MNTETNEFEGHTPGPWEWGLLQEEGSLDVCTLHGPVVLCRYWPEAPSGVNFLPDANLIAAAPELLRERDELRAQRDALLEACNAMIDVLGPMLFSAGSGYMPSEHRWVELDDRLKRVRAAIALCEKVKP